jgi:hypothetical protein
MAWQGRIKQNQGAAGVFAFGRENPVSLLPLLALRAFFAGLILASCAS